MKKKLLSFILAGCMTMTLFAGCGNNENAQDDSKNETTEETTEKTTEDTEEANSEVTDEEMPNLVMSMAWMAVPDDLEKIEAAINEITKKKIGCTVTLEGFTFGNINDQMTLILSSPSEQWDLMFAKFYGTGIPGYVNKGQLTPLNDLLDEYGQDIKAALGEDYLNAAAIDGEVYGVTTVRDLARQAGFYFRKDIIEELNIDLSTVKTYADLTPVFAQIHEAYPDLYTTGASGIQSSPLFACYGQVDQLGDYLGVLMDYNEPVVSNFYESEEFREYVELATEWNRAGYIYPDICTDASTSVQTLTANGLAASYINTYAPGSLVQNQNSMQGNYELVVAPIDEAVSFTSSVQSWMYVIPTNSKYPEKAMELLNLFYSDPDMVNLISWGIEGEHFVVNEDGFATHGPNSAGYADKATWKSGDASLGYVWEDDDADLFEQLKSFNDTAHKSCALGFTMDNSTVSAEYTALTSVLAEYRNLLEWGFATDIDATIEEFNQALYDAGLQKYMDEKQRQLDEFLGNE